MAILTIRAFRGRGRPRLNNAVFILGSIIDLTALLVILWVVPSVGESPLRVVLQSPDLRILIAALSAGLLWAVYRTYVVMKKRRHTSAFPKRPLPTT